VTDGGAPASKITASEFEALIAATIPLSRGMPIAVEALGWGTATVRLRYDGAQLRAGGTLSGPALMTLADTALYAAVLTRIGMEPLAVTSDLSIHFLRKPEPRDTIARATILRVGRRLAVGTVELESEGGALVAHVTGSYALPG
jgi:uncharacterized protein (TIGR00369 family)